jgi:hypothetical protein
MQRRNELEVSRAVIRLQARVLALVCALLGGLIMFMLTAWLVIKGGPNVGLHLRLLKHYFFGYSVTWPGSLIGALYGALVGAIIGWGISKIYNKIVSLRQD